MANRGQVNFDQISAGDRLGNGAKLQMGSDGIMRGATLLLA